MKDLTKEILDLFDERFAVNFNWGLEHSAGEYGLDVQGWEDLQSFLQEVVKRAYEEGVKDSRAVIENLTTGRYDGSEEYECARHDFLSLLSELNKEE